MRELTIVCIETLAGANSAIFSVVTPLLLARPALTRRGCD